jgi:hypothetical protein
LRFSIADCGFWISDIEKNETKEGTRNWGLKNLGIEGFLNSEWGMWNAE